MSFDHPFRWVPSLRHISQIRIGQILWRNLEDKKVIKDLCIENLPRGPYGFFLGKWYILTASISEKLEAAVDKLTLPETTNLRLKVSLIFMFQEALRWWRSTGVVNAALGQKDEDQAKTLRHFVDQMVWDDFGFVDGRSMLESYVSNKETISFGVWEQLCCHCIEKDIIKFSKTLDWCNCNDILDMHSSVYWYRRIYGELPSLRMLKYGKYSKFQRNLERGMYTEEIIAKTMFDNVMHRCSFEGTISGMIYFRNHLKDDEFIELLGANYCGYDVDGNLMFYLLRAMEKDTLMKCISFCQLQFLLFWPCIQFINDWISVFEISSPDFFDSFFQELKYVKTDPVEGIDYKILGPFEKICRVLKKRFSSNDEIIRKAFWNILVCQDAIMCRLMFEGIEKDQRQFLLGTLTDYVKSYRDDLRLGLKNEFRTQFYKQVLKDEEERKCLPEIFIPDDSTEEVNLSELSLI